MRNGPQTAFDRETESAMNALSHRGVGPGLPPKTPESKQAWDRLTALWAVFYVLFFTLARYPQFEAIVLWAGSALCVGATFAVSILTSRFAVTRETVLFALLLGWCVLGYPVVIDTAAYFYHLRLLGEYLLILWCVSYVTAHGRKAAPMHWGFVATAVISGALNFMAEEGALLAVGDQRRMFGIIGQPNAVGFTQLIGVLGVLGIIMQSGRPRSYLLLSLLPFFGLQILATGSRGPFLLLILILVGWTWLCLREHVKRHPVTAIALVLLLLGVFSGIQWVIEETFLGQRLTQGIDDPEEDKRLELAQEAFETFLANPVIGIGLNQFRVSSRSGTEAHNEIGELLSTTGAVGAGFMCAIYVGLWRTLSRKQALRTTSSKLRAQVNFARLVVLLLAGATLIRCNFTQFDSVLLIGFASGVAHRMRTAVRLPAADCVRPTNSVHTWSGRRRSAVYP